MATTKLQRNVFIGLGGSGQTSLLEIKRSLLEVYPDLDSVPAQVQFLAIDTDRQIAETLTSSGKIVKFESNEFLQVGNQGAGRVAEAAEWWPEGCSDYPKASRGASQKRLHGRAKLAVDALRVKQRLSDAISKAKDNAVETLDDDGSSAGVKVWIVSSLAGGTGAGMWYDIAGLIRGSLENDGHDELFGMFVTGDVFSSLNTVGFVLPNTYACLAELQWLNSMGAARKAMGDSYDLHAAKEIPISKDKLFDCVFLATSKNSDGLSISSPSNLFTALGRFLFFFAGEGASAFNSWWSNKNSDANMVANSHGERVPALFYGLGISEIVLDSENVKQRDAYLCTAMLFESLIGTPVSLDRQEKNVGDFLEQNEYEERDTDQMLNRFASPVEMLKQKGKYTIPESRIENKDDPAKFVGHLKKIHSADMAKWKEKLPQDIDGIVSGFVNDLTEYVGDLLKSSCVSNTVDFLKTLSLDCDLLKEDMAREASELSGKLKKRDVMLKAIMKSGLEKMGKGFTWRKTSVRCLEEVSKALGERLYCGIDIGRTKAAASSFSLMKVKVDNMLLPLLNLESSLTASKDSSSQEAKKLDRMRKEGFFRQNVDFSAVDDQSSDELVVSLRNSFLLAKPGVLVSWMTDSPTFELIRAQVQEFVESNIATHHKNRDLMQWFEQIGEQEGGSEKIMKMVTAARNNAKPFWRIARGLEGEAIDPLRTFVGLEGANGVAKKLEKALEKQSGMSASGNWVHTGDTNRLSMVTIEGPFPAFCIDGVNSWESSFSDPNSQLRNFKLTPHIDSRFDEWVPALNPRPSDSGDLETWSLGLLLDVIREEKSGRFAIKNKRQEGDPDSSGGYWVKTEASEETSAYKEFKDNREIVEDIADFVADARAAVGDVEISTRIKNEQGLLADKIKRYTKETPKKIHLRARHLALESALESQ